MNNNRFTEQQIYIIGHLVVVFLFFNLSAGSEREKYNALR